MASKTIIIDHGSGFMKAGLAGLNQPQVVIPNIINYKPCRENPGPSCAQRLLGLGIDILHPDTFSYPVKRGRVLNWEGVEYMWSAVVAKFRQEEQDYPVMITETPMGDFEDRQRTMEIMFETLDVPSLLLAGQLEMSLYASGLLTGVVVDSGFGLSRVQPFLLGQPLPSCAKTLELAGQDIEDYLFKSLFKEKHNQHNVFQMHTVNSVQMRKCYVPQNLAEALDFCQGVTGHLDDANTYLLPDGTPVELTPMQRLAPEMLFSPQVFDLPGPSISEAVVDSIDACEASDRPTLLSHVMACGGSSLCPGFINRLFSELTTKHYAPEHTVMWVSPRQNFSVWLGASVVAHLSTYRSEWVTKEQYLEGKRM